MDTKGRTVKSFIAVSAALILLLAVFAFPASAEASDNPAVTFQQELIPSCPLYPTEAQLPFKDTCVFSIQKGSYRYWFFLDAAKNQLDDNYFSYFSIYALGPSDSADIYMTSSSKIVSVMQYVPTGDIMNYNPDIQYNNGFYAWSFEFSNTDPSTYTLYCNYAPTYMGTNAITAAYEGDLDADELWNWKAIQYPSSEIEALNSVYNQVSELQEVIEDNNRMIASLQRSNNELKTEIQEGNSEVKEEVQEQATNIVNDINNAGEDEESLDTDLSWMDSTINTLQGWADTIDGFADTIESAGDEIEEYIESGSGIVSKFLDIVPGPVLAALAFGLVFIVVKKIVGREG